MSRREGTLKLSSNIEPRASAPLDARLVVPTLADLTTSGAFPYPYVGMIVSVQSEGKAYMLTASDPTVSANWSEIGGGGNVDNVLEEIDTLPEATIELIGKRYLYTGEDTLSFKHGGIYECQDNDLFVDGVAPEDPSYFDSLGLFESVTPELQSEIYRWVPATGVTVKFIDMRSENPRLETVIEITYNLSSGGYYFYALKTNYSTPNYYFFYPSTPTNYVLTTGLSWNVINDVKSGDSIFEGTMDEWDALTVEQKAMYDFIATPESGEDAEKDIYSTTEVKTNKVWIDGKPIYRKVINVGNIPDTTSKSTAHNIANIGTIIICEGRAVANTTAKTSIGLPYVNTDGSTMCIQVYANVTDVVVKTATNTWINYVGFVILEYTKTTDG